MIPQEIQTEHLLYAIQEIDRDGYPRRHSSARWDLVHNGKFYPPKWTVSLAGKYALGEVHSDKLFSGGSETNNFLRSRGFQIVDKEWPSAPVSAHSWTIENNLIAFKVLDKSAYLHSGTGIPIEVRPYFVDSEMKSGEKRPAILNYQGQEYSSHIEMDHQPTPRTRLMWGLDFAKILRESFPHHYLLHERDRKPESPIILRFERIDDFHSYEVSFSGELSEETAASDIEADELEDRGPVKEGAVKEYYGKRYERSPMNRKDAIRIHGLACNACGFNFEKVYGSRGADFIEVHHIKPIHTYEEEQPVDPRTDLTTVCSNCHRMIHRDKSNILSLDALRNLFIQFSR